jgi:hypothetical protein
VERTVSIPTVTQALDIGNRFLYWAVRANFAGATCSSYISIPRALVVIGVPEPPVLSLPADGAEACSGVPVYFSWHASLWGDQSTVQWDDNAAFASPDSLSTPGVSTQRALAAGICYWRARINSSCDTGTWSPYRTVTVEPQLTASLRRPAAGTLVLSDSAQEYCGFAVPGAVSYTFQWANNAGFSGANALTSLAPCTTQTLVGSGTWYWRACANSALCPGAWTAAREITLVQLDPPEVVLKFDSDSLRISWNRVPDAQSYRIEVADQPGGPFAGLATQSDTTRLIAPGGRPIRFYRVIAVHP